MPLTLRQRTSQLLDGNGPRNIAVRSVRWGLFGLILLNVALGPQHGGREDLAYGEIFDAIESVSLFVFATEYLLRVWVAPEASFRTGEGNWKSRLRWMASAEGLIDLLAVAPFVLGQMTDVDLRVITLVRLLRFFKFARYSPGFLRSSAARAERHGTMACIRSGIGDPDLGRILYVLEHKASPTSSAHPDDVVGGRDGHHGRIRDVVPVTMGAHHRRHHHGGRVAHAGIAGRYRRHRLAGIIARQNFAVTGSGWQGCRSSRNRRRLDHRPSAVGRHAPYGPGEYIVRRGEAVRPCS